MKDFFAITVFLFTAVFTNSQNNQIDTAQYQNLPYRDSTIYASGEQGYIDTFSIANSHFRLVHHDTLFDAIVEKNINGVWTKCFDEIMMGNYNDYTLEDVNDDGYKDFVHMFRWGGDVYLFDHEINSFINIPTAGVSFDWTLIDSTHKIFCDFQQGKGMKGQLYSSLYTFKSYYREDLYKVELDNYKADSLIIGFILYKYIHDEGCIDCITTKLQKIKEIRLVKPINTETTEDYFDYVKFWKERYKKLLDYH